MEPAQTGRFWPLSPRLWRRSNEYSKVVFENRRPLQIPLEIRENNQPSLEKHPVKERNSHLFPDLIRTRSFRDREQSRKTPEFSQLEETKWDYHKWSVQKPPVKESKKEEVVKLRVKKQRQPRPNSLQLLLCPSGSGHYSSNTWRYTRVRSKRFVVLKFCNQKP